ncbi:MAG TPA: hypothetical protein VF466_03695 [Candidatus Saccharimonadales bacterium]
MTAYSLGEIQLTLPCACGARVPFTLGQGAAGLQLLCPRCGANVHLQDRQKSVQRAMLRSSTAMSRAQAALRRFGWR